MTDTQTTMFKSPFRDVLRAIDQSASKQNGEEIQRERGTLFEQVCKTYFQEDSLYRQQFSKVWLWSEFPERFGNADTGIDIVAQNMDDGHYTAIQCKFYGENSQIRKDDIDSFIATSGIHVKGGPRFTKRIVISTTGNWSTYATESLQQDPPIIRLGIHDIENSSINWAPYSIDHLDEITHHERKTPRTHQQEAISSVLNGFKAHNRGKLIMACGTGKTFTALKIAEQQTKPGDIIVFFAPSITLVSQSIREWCNENASPMKIHAVCSDTKVARESKQKGGEDDSVNDNAYDIIYTPTTNANTLYENVSATRDASSRTVIFSTYQSLDVITKAQELGMGDIALVICDEAHRTTGVTLSGIDESNFVRVHNDQKVRADKRLYMTATPRIFGAASKSKAEAAKAVLASMDDERIYGPEFYRYYFADAVEDGQLCDYRVLVFGIDQSGIAQDPRLQGVLADEDLDLNLNDIGKLIASWNAMSKKRSQYEQFEQDPTPMSSVVAFASRIKESKAFSDAFNAVIEQYKGDDPRHYEADHVDGRVNALERANKLDALRGAGADECRVLSNAKCLTEGVDVPALDGILFLSPRRSHIDVVQAVGRAMRKSQGKKYGYIIIPVVVDATEDYESVILDRRFNPTFQVLEALKSHDEQFYDTINQADLKGNKKISVVIFSPGSDNDNGDKSGSGEPVQMGLDIDLSDKVRDAIYARIVSSLTDTHYYKRWADDTADVCDAYEKRIAGLLKSGDKQVKNEFAKFLAALKNDLNEGIDEDKATGLLAQHLVTRPVFDAMFSQYEFTKENPVSQAMDKIIEVLRFEHGTDSESRSLNDFYKSVHRRVQHVDSAEKKQRIIADLYQDFFRKAFPKDASMLGIAYTPVEAVDFVVRSVEDILRANFDVGLTDKGVDILDPFTGTGTFITRTLESGLIKPEDLVRKYTQELHANEITLLAYYIAAVNIEMTYHELVQAQSKAAVTEYTPFNGIVFADTFEAAESNGLQSNLSAEFFEANSERMQKQSKRDIRVIIGNPPWSVGQRSRNDDSQNRRYERLRNRIADTYSKESSAVSQRSLYDLYIQSIRTASDRIQQGGQGGIIAFVTNGGFIDTEAAAGLRKCLLKEFHKVYCLNMRGNQRTSGDVSRKEGGKLFDSKSRAPVAVLMLIKNHGDVNEPGTLYYHEVEDFLNREEKLAYLADNKLTSVPWREIIPDEHGDWINQRDPGFANLVPLYGKDDAIFNLDSLGMVTNRDAWCYNFSRKKIEENAEGMLKFFNDNIPTNNPEWSKKDFKRTRKSDRLARLGTTLEFSADRAVQSMYRAFTKQVAYFARNVNEEVGQQERIYPRWDLPNIGIAITDKDKSNPMCGLMTSILPNLSTMGAGTGMSTRYLPRWTYEKPLLSEDEFERVNNINSVTLTRFRQQYADENISEDDLFYYVYGMLHHPEYRARYATNLRKEAARVPIVLTIEDFRSISNAGKELSELHLNYESAEPYPLEEDSSVKRDMFTPLPDDYYAVTRKKMDYPKKKDKIADFTALAYNEYITLRGIPEAARRYQVGQWTALDWIRQRYLVKTDKDSGVVNDPNDWCDEHGDPRYIIDLIKRIVTVSVKTMEIVDSLPELPQ